jgi:cyclopropane fatty-acyl-phospholipid synthase-like methyltransferase
MRGAHVYPILQAGLKHLKAEKKKMVGRSDPAAKLVVNTSLYISSLWSFLVLIRQGLRKQDVLVDYGCGTMRIGMHAVRYLGEGAYWGLDVSDAQLEKARLQLGPRLLAKKRPHVCRISPTAINECTAAQPNLLCSIDVMHRVPPENLPEFLHNIVFIIGPSGRAIIRARWSGGATFQYKQLWAYSLDYLKQMVSDEGARLDTVWATDWECGPGKTGNAGLLSIVR